MGSQPTLNSVSGTRILKRTVRPWIQLHPGATVVELGAKTSAHFRCCDNGDVWWICVGLPTSLDARENYLAESDRCHQVFADVLDLSWMDEVDASGDVLIMALGLFMYLEKSAVRHLLAAIVERFPGASIVFDTIPHWASHRARQRAATLNQPLPIEIPWGINRGEIEPLLLRWLPHINRVTVGPHCYSHSLKGEALRAASALPILRDRMPAVVEVQLMART